MALRVWSSRYRDRGINVGRLLVVFRGEYAELPDWAVPEYNWLVTNVPGVRPAPPPPEPPPPAVQVSAVADEEPPPEPAAVAAVEHPAPEESPAPDTPPAAEVPEVPAPAVAEAVEPKRRGRRAR